MRLSLADEAVRLAGNLDPQKRSLLQDATACAADDLRKLRAKKRKSDWLVAHSNRIPEYNRRWYLKHRTEIIKRRKSPEEIRKKAVRTKSYQKTKAYKDGRRRLYEKHGESMRAKARAYGKTPAGRRNQCESRKRRRKESEAFRFAELMRGFINNAFDRLDGAKAFANVDLFGCSWDQFKKHIESQWEHWMNWGNRNKWHIDHIVPLSAFNLACPMEQKWAFFYKNVRPLERVKNQSKGNKLPDVFPDWFPPLLAAKLRFRSQKQASPPI